MNYVAGFLFRAADFGVVQVALIKKNRPEWQAGKLNGIGGKIEAGETPLDAMRREFQEETGARVENWRAFATLNFAGGVVHFFTSNEEAAICSMTDETVRWIAVGQVRFHPAISNIHWLIPLALDGRATATVTETA